MEYLLLMFISSLTYIYIYIERERERERVEARCLEAEIVRLGVMDLEKEIYW